MSLKSLLSWSLSVAAITLSVTAHASEPALQQQINTILIAAPQKGQRADFQQYVNYYFASGTSFDTNVDRDVKYFSVIGLVDPASGEFFPQMISTVSESWRKTEQGWNVGQNIREVTLDGRVYKALAQTLVFEGAGRLKDILREPAAEASADQAAFEAEVRALYTELTK